MTMDVLYIGIAVLFFALTWGLLKGCDRLSEGEEGKKS